MDINNRYKRFQGYRKEVSPNNFKKDYMDQQNMFYENKQLENKPELGQKRELPKQDNSFLKSAVRLDVHQGKFIKK